MGIGLADHLAALDRAPLARLLAERPDACAEPVPQDVHRLADRLQGRPSLALALARLDQDVYEVGRAIAALGNRAGVDSVAELLGADPALVRRPVDVLESMGLAWPDGPTVRLPSALAEHWGAEIGGDEPIARAARDIAVDTLRVIAEIHGLDVAGMRKAEVTQALHDAWADPATLRPRVAALGTRERNRLADLCRGGATAFGGPSVSDRRLVEAGLLLPRRYDTCVPREVAIAVWLGSARLGGVPDRPAPADDAERVAAGAEAAAQGWLRLLTTVLDDAAVTPIPELKGGGVGKRERARLVKRLDLGSDTAACLALDLADAAGLLGRTEAGYAPTATYATWRDGDAAGRWAQLATAWFALDHAPNARAPAGKEIPPPKPLTTPAGDIRRTLLQAVGDRSVAATEAEVGWFCPWHGCDDAGLADVVTAAHREAELLGVVVGDALSPLGGAVVAGGTGADAGAAVSAAVATLVVDPACEVVLQSDLTALVTGRPSVAVSRLLDAAAAPESRGTATTYRFSPATVRAALDAGWDADGLLGALREVSAAALPQPLEYLVGDVARRHGQVRVRPAGSCIVLDETLAEEVVATRGLRSLGLARLAPTVLASPADPATVLTAMRGAGYFPVSEDESGALVVERGEARVATADPRPARDALAPDVLAARLHDAATAPRAAPSLTTGLLAQLNPELDASELDLLADAVDHERDVTITYCDQNGSISHRTVTPIQLLDRWLVAWCHLRRGERDFTVANIQDVSPPRR